MLSIRYQSTDQKVPYLWKIELELFGRSVEVGVPYRSLWKLLGWDRGIPLKYPPRRPH